MTKTGSLRLEENKITLEFPDGTFQIYEKKQTPSYNIGTIYFDYLGDRYFLTL